MGRDNSVVAPVILLGLGFTTRRLARRLLVRRVPVFAASREPGRFGELAELGVEIGDFRAAGFPLGACTVHTIPPLAEAENAGIHEFIRQLEPRRVVYISATSVYGEQTTVDAETRVSGCDEKSRRRIEEEEWIAAGPWSSLMVRPAAIYGPGRGVHTRIMEGRLPRGTGSGVVSRIHVDDLAAVLEAGILSDVEGAWPLADDRPCSSEEIAAWCTRLLRLGGVNGKAATFPVAGRHVDGRKIRELLGITLMYPSYESGILASLAEERVARQRD